MRATAHPPHRAYRSVAPSPWGLALLGLGLVGLQVALYSNVAWLVDAQARLAQAALEWAGYTALPTQVLWGSLELSGLLFPLRAPDSGALLGGALLGALLLIAAIWWTALGLVARQLLGLVGLVVLVAAVWLGLFPELGYTPRELAELYTRTQAGVWLLIGPMAVLACLPISSLVLRLGLLGSALGYAFALGVLRLCVWYVLLTAFGSLSAPVLYFFLGFSLEVFGLIGLYSFFLYQQSVRGGRQWRWL